MDFSFDESKILYGIGAFLGVTSIFYFGSELIFDLSPTVKSVILVLFSASFFLSGDLIDSGLLSISTYIFSSFTYLSFLLYVFIRFNLSQTQILVLLTGSSALFISLGYVRNEGLYSLDAVVSKRILGILSIALIALVGVDVAGSQPEYRLDLKDSVEASADQASPRDQVIVGELTVQNNFVLSRNMDLPEYDGCVAYNQSTKDNLFIDFDGEGIIGGDTTKKFNLTEDISIRSLQQGPNGNAIRENEVVEGNYTIIQGECPDRPDNQSIYISSDESSVAFSGVD